MSGRWCGARDVKLCNSKSHGHSLFHRLCDVPKRFILDMDACLPGRALARCSVRQRGIRSCSSRARLQLGTRPVLRSAAKESNRTHMLCLSG